MKKTLAILVALILLFTGVSAFAEDYSTYSDDDLYAIIDGARTELLNRKIGQEGNPVLLEADNLTVTLSGDPVVQEAYSGGYNMILNVVAVNSGNEDISFIVDEMYINGWKVSALEGGEIGAGKKAKIEMTFYEVDTKAEIISIEMLEDIEFRFYTYDPNTYSTLTDGIVTKLVF